jgi:hypothetical protein
VDPNQITQTFDLELSKIAKLEEPRHQFRGVLGQVSASRRSELLHPCCEAHGLALRGVVHSKVIADPSHDDFS